MKLAAVWIPLIAFSLMAGRSLAAQEVSAPTEPQSLASLLAEAERGNPRIQAARQAWEAAKLTPTQVSTLPDPQVMVQQFSVGSPRPFAGYTNSDFAYIGLGFSQDIPYPGKLRLRGEIAKKDAEVVQQQCEAVRKTVLRDLKEKYYQLAFLARKDGILQSDRTLLGQVEQAAEARYRTGSGSQQEVLQAQLEQTKLLGEITRNQLDAGILQVGLKQLLGRPQSSADIDPAPLAQTALPYTYAQLLDAAKANNPLIAAMHKTVERQNLQIDLARKDFYPDFNVQYMWQRTDPSQFRAYYMLTFGMRIPLYRGRKQKPELAQAEVEKSRAQSEYENESQEVAAELQRQFATAEKSAELLKIYTGGLIPQARAELQAGMAAYQSNRQDFQALLSSFLDVLRLEQEYWQTMADREAALAQIEETTGLSLR